MSTAPSAIIFTKRNEKGVRLLYDHKMNMTGFTDLQRMMKSVRMPIKAHLNMILLAKNS